jgi:hypothetical protein
LINNLKKKITSKPLFSIIAISFLIRFCLAFLIPISLHGDQIYQTLEPAHYLAFGRGFLAWEWHDGIRSWAYPGFLAGIMKLCSYISSNPRFYISIIHIIMICFSLAPIVITYKLTHKLHEVTHNKKTLSLLAASLPAFGSILIVYSYFTLNGMIPAYLFSLNCYLIIKQIDLNNSTKKENSRSLILIGAIFGLITILRFHLLPEIAFAMLYCSRKNFIYRAKFLILGFLLTFLPLGFLDWATWGYPFHSIIYNFYLNVFKGVSKSFGVAPFYWYLKKIFFYLNIFLIPLLYLSYLGFKKHPLFIWIGLINLFSFSLIEHKETRFIFLFFVCFFISSGLGVAEFYNLISNKNFTKNIKTTGIIATLENILKKYFLKIYACTLLIFIAIAYGATYYRYKSQSLIFMINLHNIVDKRLNSQVSKIFQFAHKEDAFCGGGYTYLNIDAPYNYQNCWGYQNHWGDSEPFLTKYENNLEKTKVIITDKDKLLLGGITLYCDNNFCAYAYPYQINNTKYYLWKLLPFYI